MFQLSESAPYALGLDEPFLGGLFRHLCPAVLSGRLDGLENSLVVPHQIHDYDVLVIGAGGAGLRAAIEAAAAGVSVGMVCKSLLGKAHTVMAEGGIAAALANVDERDNWKVPSRIPCAVDNMSTMRMAELHAKEAPQCVREFEAWGALFDRTSDGRILQRNLADIAILAWLMWETDGAGNDSHPAGPRHSSRG